MKRIRNGRIAIAAIAGATLFCSAIPAFAQSYSNYYDQGCRLVAGRLVCPPSYTYAQPSQPAPSTTPSYSGSSTHHSFPYSIGSYHTWYGFGH